jgi:hypothetical protein
MKGTTNIYVMGTAVGDIAYKIGHATKPEKRRSQLYSGSPFGARLLGSTEIPKEVVNAVEKSLHKRYSASQVGGEWFALPEGRSEKWFIKDVLESAPLFAQAHQASKRFQAWNGT